MLALDVLALDVLALDVLALDVLAAASSIHRGSVSGTHAGVCHRFPMRIGQASSRYASFRVSHRVHRTSANEFARIMYCFPFLRGGKGFGCGAFFTSCPPNKNGAPVSEVHHHIWVMDRAE